MRMMHKKIFKRMWRVGRANRVMRKPESIFRYYMHTSVASSVFRVPSKPLTAHVYRDYAGGLYEYNAPEGAMTRKRKPEVDEVMKRTALFFEPSQMARLQMLAEITGAPTAELVRRAVKMYLDERKDEIDAGEKK
jgi:hypothetical protein